MRDPWLVPRITHNISPRTGRDYGYEIEFERRNEDGRTSGLIVGELTMDDLEALREALTDYLDKAARGE